VTGSERAKTVHALDRAATVTGSERAKTVHALDLRLLGPAISSLESKLKKLRNETCLIEVFIFKSHSGGGVECIMGPRGTSATE
jgi:hypothetical protein